MVAIVFFKQKTAYEIYQCDWSSDVCSSDLLALAGMRSSNGAANIVRTARRSTARDRARASLSLNSALSPVGQGALQIGTTAVGRIHGRNDPDRRRRSRTAAPARRHGDAL